VGRPAIVFVTDLETHRPAAATALAVLCRLTPARGPRAACTATGRAGIEYAALVTVYNLDVGPTVRSVVDLRALPMMCAGVGAAIQITTAAGTPYFIATPMPKTLSVAAHGGDAV